MNRNISVFSLTMAAQLAVFSLFTGCATSPASHLKVGSTAEGEVVEAEGMAAMTNDLLAVKKAALEDARKAAVEKVVGVLISARTMVEKAITIQQTVLAKTDGYVKNYDILKEGKEPDGIYHMKIRALVSFKEVRDDLMASEVLKLPVVGNPRVAILLDETVEGVDGQNTACSDALAQGLIEKGYKVVDRSELSAIRVAEATKDLLAGDTDKALKPIVQKLNAEVVITGKATTSLLTMQGLGGLISYRGSISAKALKAQTGEILATLTTQGSGLDATKEAASMKALAQLGKNAANDFGGKIASELARRSSILVSVQGIADVNKLGRIKDIISKLPGVVDVYMRSFSVGNAELELKIDKATSADVAGALMKDASIGAQVVSQTQDTLELKVQ